MAVVLSLFEFLLLLLVLTPHSLRVSFAEAEQSQPASLFYNFLRWMNLQDGNLWKHAALAVNHDNGSCSFRVAIQSPSNGLVAFHSMELANFRAGDLHFIRQYLTDLGTFCAHLRAHCAADWRRLIAYYVVGRVRGTW